MIYQNTFRKIRRSWGRYLSLLCIVFLGVCFYAGVHIASPSILDVQKEYYDETNLMDIKIVSNLGLTKDDVFQLSQLEIVDQVEGSYTTSVLEDTKVLQVHSLLDHINGVDLQEGRLPLQKNECLADASNYQVGDVISVQELQDENQLATHEFQVVGTVTSPLYTGNTYGNINAGDGQLYSYLFVLPETFLLDFYTEIYLTFLKGTDDVIYSDSYVDLIHQGTEQIKPLQNHLEQQRYEGIKEDIQKQIETLESYQAMGISSYNDVLERLYHELATLESKWYVLTRSDVVISYDALETQYQEVTTITDIIPIFFIFIVLLMTSNTMSRMITEERGEMGALISLGYMPKAIIGTYLFYVLSATLVGAILGYFVGTIFLPPLVYACFPVNMPALSYHFDFVLFSSILIFTILVMSGVTIWSVQKTLKLKPAYLLRPEAPKSGKRLFLEHFSFWRHLSFSWKITWRNFFRDKKRVFMTMIGSAGCTLLILIGFALQDSINGVGEKQYTDILLYDQMVLFHQSYEELPTDFEQKLDSLLPDKMLLLQSLYTVFDSEEHMDSYLVVPSQSDLNQYFHLFSEIDRKDISLNDEGVVVTSQLAKRFSLKKGSTMQIRNADGEVFEVKVSNVVENYVANYIYMTPEYYETIFDEAVLYNAIVANTQEDEKFLAQHLLSLDEVLSVQSSSSLREQVNTGIRGLDNIVILLIVIASVLAFTVLYNLTSINISERMREIATLKVLGYYETETNSYIYRETMISVILGIFIGVLGTIPLHAYLITLLETDGTMFLRSIHITSFLYAILITLFFAIVMQFVTYFKLKKVDMIEALKAVE